jgi:hypothetical protein
VGLLASDGDGFSWLCDEAISNKPGFNDLAPLDADGVVWVAATRFGLFRTLDGGCTFTPVGERLGRHQVAGISPNPAVPGEALLYTETTTLDDDVYVTTDAGETWTPAGLDLFYPIHSLVRSAADPRRVYAIHDETAVRSDDGGRSFAEMAFAPPGDDAEPRDVYVLATDPHDANVVYAAILRLPEPHLIRSDDGGASWALLSRLEGNPHTLVISPTDGTMLLSVPSIGLKRSTDGGETWTPLPLLEDGQSVSCMFTAPDGAVWACALRGHQFVIRSTDFGDTWRPAFARDFTQVTSSWACGEETPTAMACAEACDRAVEDCGEVPLDEDAGVDAMPPPEAGPAVDATVVDATVVADLAGTRGGGGAEASCQSNSGGPITGGLALLLLIALRRQRG